MTMQNSVVTEAGTDVVGEAPLGKPDLLRSTALECLNAADESKYRAIRAELRQLAKAYMDRARTTEAGAPES